MKQDKARYQETILYSDLSEIPIPEGTDPIDCLYAALAKAEGILSLMVDEKGKINGGDINSAVWAIAGLLRQSKALVDYWHRLDSKTGK